MPARSLTPTLVWLDPAQGPLVQALVEAGEISIAAWGCPGGTRGAEGPQGPHFDAANRVDDLRLALATRDIRAVLLAASASFDSSAGDPPIEDADLLRLCRSRGIAALALEPVPASVRDAAAAEASHWAETCCFVTLFRRAPGLSGLGELLDAFGPARTISVSFRSGHGQGSLGARLFDAMHLVHSIMGVPESIDAAVVTHVASSGVRVAPGESLRRLTGDLTANLRFAGAKAAAISLSDRAGRWFRGVAVIGEAGCLRLDETGVERIDQQGRTVERTGPKRQRRVAGGADESVDVAAMSAITEGVRRALDPRTQRSEPMDYIAVLSMCEAAMLSARTGQPESPATVLRMSDEQRL
jgi:hypothetical protein